MTATLVTIQQCNDENILVYVDTCVIIPAIRDPQSQLYVDLLRIKLGLRRYASTTLYEVAFSRKTDGHDLSKLKDNQKWLADRFPARDRLDGDVGEAFEELLTAYASAARGKADLGDAVLAAWARARSSPTQKCAIATVNGRDFRALPVALVAEFLPTTFSLED